MKILNILQILIYTYIIQQFGLCKNRTENKLWNYQNKTAKQIFNIPQSFTICLEGITQMPGTKEPARSPNISFIYQFFSSQNNDSSFHIIINNKTLQLKS